LVYSFYFIKDNFRPNIRIITNILLVIGIYLIAFNLSQINNGLDKSNKQREIDCSDAASGVISYKDLLGKYNMGKFENKRKNFEDYDLLTEFCQFYMFQ
tara:strand:+ start:204 stop:500 length:297 start_codon:yes stop_codon:yes gene_type:complete